MLLCPLKIDRGLFTVGGIYLLYLSQENMPLFDKSCALLFSTHPLIYVVCRRTEVEGIEDCKRYHAY